ncbi:acetoin utilization AcuB family protein [Alkalihalobacillus trypoxylicola]|uniref:Acetoin utilization protein AcuB n=1 Tax=Alkalihalobacillus trypoxylicola TaxID=519424 RepID=A0A162CUE4_9BACI|nr:acetoin utilization AcuB family protein [Alkalihalobacillus trypoxylicola]KYG26684.1 acetoin utilization protein AcuB [Alkalihalobacillus trypoxylicola]
MLVEDIMRKEVMTLKKDATIKDAIQLLEEKRIRHLPIVDESFSLIGIVSDRDIRDARPSIFTIEKESTTLEQSIETLMKKEVITAHPLDFIQDVSSLFYENHIGCLPIIDQNKLVGILTEKEILYSLIELIGANQPSSHIEVSVPNRTGVLADVAAIFKKNKTNIVSVIVRPAKHSTNQILVFRIQTIDPRRVVDEIRSSGYDVLWPNIPGGKQ